MRLQLRLIEADNSAERKHSAISPTCTAPRFSSSYYFRWLPGLLRLATTRVLARPISVGQKASRAAPSSEGKMGNIDMDCGPMMLASLSQSTLGSCSDRDVGCIHSLRSN